jgi:hypothetical protein
VFKIVKAELEDRLFGFIEDYFGGES